jgi:hypothetical protein
MSTRGDRDGKPGPVQDPGEWGMLRILYLASRGPTVLVSPASRALQPQRRVTGDEVAPNTCALTPTKCRSLATTVGFYYLLLCLIGSNHYLANLYGYMI